MESVLRLIVDWLAVAPSPAARKTAESWFWLCLLSAVGASAIMVAVKWWRVKNPRRIMPSRMVQFPGDVLAWLAIGIVTGMAFLVLAFFFDAATSQRHLGIAGLLKGAFVVFSPVTAFLWWLFHFLLPGWRCDLRKDGQQK